MIIQIFFAVSAGVLTIAAPCILPMLPIVLGASVGQQSKQRPLLIVSGFIVSFAATSLLLAVIIEHLGLPANVLRNSAVFLLFVFAVFMIWPRLFELLTTKFTGVIKAANQMGNGNGNMGGLLLGLVLGVIWTPCAGPVLGSILTLIATQGSTAHSAVLLVAYAFGAAIPMLVIAYGSQIITTKVRVIAQYAGSLQKIFGVLVLFLAVAMFFQYDVKIQAALTAAFPQSKLESNLVSSGNPIAGKTNASPDTMQAKSAGDTLMQKVDLQNYGVAPDFTGISHWLNSDPLTLSQLKGKVVLVDFWTYSCINCIRTLPYVTKWYDTYRNQGLMVVGVHTPEFAFEKETNNVSEAVSRFKINYPVAQDNNYQTWQAYGNQYWPAEYLIDQNGNIVYEHFGEGEYDHTENAILQLLGRNADAMPNNGQDLSKVGSPEMYFETARLQYLTPDQQPSDSVQTYTLTQNLKLNNFALEGSWKFDDEKAALINGPGKIRLHFKSGKAYMVASGSNPDKPITLKILVDGKSQPDVEVGGSKLYTLYNSDNYGEHIIDIEITDSGFNAFTFTFG